jgi:putative SOS response-associated peptidase YedK
VPVFAATGVANLRTWEDARKSVRIAEMCGRFTRNYTWEQIHALYRLTAPVAIPNLQPRFNACPTDPADTIVVHDGKRQLVEMRWGLVPFWWSKPLKELRLATFNARVETVTTKPFFREPFKNKRCLMPVSGYSRVARHAGGQAALVFHSGRWISGTHDRGPLG